MTRTGRFLIATMALCGTPVAAQETRKAPLSDTEDASITSVDVGVGRVHPVLALDLRNGDFVRGDFDDDAANLDRVPVHARIGLVWELSRDDRGDAVSWLMLQSSNGFHAASPEERVNPRGWYESNNLAGIAARLAPDLTGALTYTIKSSPNGASTTTHELGVAGSLSGKTGLAALRPGFAATWRPKGGGGLYTQATVEPGIDLSAGETPARISIPAVIGIGWDDFYDGGSGDRLYGSAGIALEQPLTIGTARMKARIEALALVRDDRLRFLGGPAADTSMVVPYARISLSIAH